MNGLAAGETKSGAAERGRETVRTPRAVIASLACLYVAQGTPFGIASEYIPVVLFERHWSHLAVASLTWLQLPWQLKIFWAHAADDPRVRPHSRGVLLSIQLLLAVLLGGYALFPLAAVPRAWFAITAVAAFVAATQDVFVDALAVRSLGPHDRGLGNVAQVAGYRGGILLGGAGLLVLVGWAGERVAVAVVALLVLAASGAAFVLRNPRAEEDAPLALAPEEGAAARIWMKTMRHALAPDVRVVLVFALVFKFGVHMASALLKPMVIHAGWTKAEIGLAIVTAGAAATFLGAGLGGLVHRRTRETRALAIAVVAQSLVGLPLIVAELLGAPRLVTTVAIAMDHFASGFGTTILFAALMTATRASVAGLHYTLLTSANALGLGLGGMAGAKIADQLGRATAFGASVVVAALPLALIPFWRAAAEKSAAEPP